MAANTGERTLISAVIPPGAAHIDGVFSVACPTSNPLSLVDVAAQLSALTSDLLVRAAPKANIRAATVDRLPRIRSEHPLLPDIRLRYLRLACLTEAYAEFWTACFEEEFTSDHWAVSPDVAAEPLGRVARQWDVGIPLRRAVDRRQAMIELDALVAVSLGITAHELTTIYRTQFPVLAGYDRGVYFFDANGRLVPSVVLAAWRASGGSSEAGELTATHPGSGIRYEYRLPIEVRDREVDLRDAHTAFSERLERRRSNSE